ncbi:MAG: DUF367 family protein [Promethearchaeota archaeon]
MPISNPAKEVPKLFCFHYRECNPKKCTAFKLSKLHLIEIINNVKGILKNSIILNPFARKELSHNDRNTILRYGLTVIDCSWNNIMVLKKFDFKNSRKLPRLIAVNPTNYGKWEKLSSAEALAGALFITNFIDYATLILSKFSWGSQFKDLNKF